MSQVESERSIAVSVIVPVFNTRDYLPRCLDSLVNQALENLEIVAVDDGSTDDSPEILQHYAAADRRIKIVRHERNQGLHIARMTGVLASRGQYLGYVDSDDYASREMFASLYHHAVDRQADVVRTGASVLWEGSPRSGAAAESPTTLAFANCEYPSGIEYIDSDFYPSMCLHLHHHRLWQAALPHFPQVRLIGEDNLTSFVLAYFAGPVVSLSTSEYFYVERAGTISNDLSFSNVAQHIEDRGQVVALLRAFLDAYGGGGERGWLGVRANNKGLLFSFIGELKRRDERVAAMALFEARWGERIPAHLQAQWAAQ